MRTISKDSQRSERLGEELTAQPVAGSERAGVRVIPTIEKPAWSSEVSRNHMGKTKPSKLRCLRQPRIGG